MCPEFIQHGEHFSGAVEADDVTPNKSNKHESQTHESMMIRVLSIHGGFLL